MKHVIRVIFMVNIFFGDEGFQNMFIYQPTFNTLELKIDKGAESVTGWTSKVLFEWNFFHYMVLSCEHKVIWMQNRSTIQ